MTDSKDFLKFDIPIILGFIAYYLFSFGVFDEDYSDGYKAVSNFFLFTNLFGVAL